MSNVFQQFADLRKPDDVLQALARNASNGPPNDSWPWLTFVSPQEIDNVLQGMAGQTPVFHMDSGVVDTEARTITKVAPWGEMFGTGDDQMAIVRYQWVNRAEYERKESAAREAKERASMAALRLKEAAPDLLEACQAMLSSSGLIGNNPDVATAVRMMQDAVAKATLV